MYVKYLLFIDNFNCSEEFTYLVYVISINQRTKYKTIQPSKEQCIKKTIIVQNNKF